MKVTREIHCQNCHHPNRFETELNADQKAKVQGNWYLTNQLIKSEIGRDLCPNCGKEYRIAGTKLGIPRA